MDKSIENNNATYHSHQISISDRKQVIMSGIKKIISFDNEEFLMESVMGTILLKGEALEIIKLDTTNGNVSIKGKVNALSYLDNNTPEKKEDGFIAKLFK